MTESTDPGTTHRGGAQAVAGLAAALAGPIAYLALLPVPWARSTGAPAWVLIAIGAVLGLRAAGRDGRRWVRAVAGGTLAFGLLFAVLFFYALRLPAGAAAALETAPDFTLPDHQGRDGSLKVAHNPGPVLLVFYRGRW